VKAVADFPVPVLLMVRELDQGGIERDVAKVAMHIDRSRFEPHVASYNAHGLRFDELRRAGVPMLHVPLQSLISPAAISAAARVSRYIRRHGIRLVHAYDSSAAFVVPLARCLRVPVVLSSMLGHRTLLDARTHRLFRMTDRLVDAVVVNCEAMRRHLIEDEKVPPERIELCYNGVDTREFYPQEQCRPKEVANASLVIGSVCALRPEKALDVLQKAFAHIRHLAPGLKLLIVGSGAELPRLQANSARLDIADATVFVPATPEVARFLRAMDIFVLCSRSEAFSNALLEAMACGCCAVGSRVGGTPELLGPDSPGDEERGLLCRPGDAADLAEKLRLLILNPELRDRLRARAVRFASTTLTVEKNVQRTAEIFETMLRRNKTQNGTSH
jgi:glycosyltransferase involved in cell wall biosynthesis